MSETNINLLLEAFAGFNQASASLEQAYEELQQRANQLSLDLERANLELKQSLDEKEKVESYLKNILQSLTRGVLVLDLSGAVVLCNRAASEQMGIALSVGELLPAEMNDHAIRPLVEEALRDPDDFIEGREIEVDAADETQLILSVSKTPVRDESGRCIGVSLIFSDITRLRSLERENRDRERLSAMGEMAVELAHEIRNPLGSIEIFASLIEERLDGRPEEQGLAHQISVGVKSLNNIVSNMLTFTKAAEPMREPFDLNDLILSTLDFIKPVVSQHGIQLARRFDLDEAPILADKGMFRQLLLNLFFNALHALPQGGLLEVSTRQATPGSVQLAVRDTGAGIAPDKLARIFDPFYTTHRHGTGLGLLIVHRIVSQHGGTIAVESELNRGARFQIEIPMMRGAFGGGAGKRHVVARRFLAQHSGEKHEQSFVG